MPNPDAEKAYNRAVNLAITNRFAEALSLYDQALSLDPANPQYWSDKAIALLNLQRYEECISCTEEANRLDPAMVDPWINRGAAYGRLCRYDEASKALEQALALDPGNRYARTNYAVLLRRVKEETAKSPGDVRFTEDEIRKVLPPPGQPEGMAADQMVTNALHGDVRWNGLTGWVIGGFYGFMAADIINPLAYPVFFLACGIGLVIISVIWAGRIERDLALKQLVSGLNELESEIRGHALWYLWANLVPGIILGALINWVLRMAGL